MLIAILSLQELQTLYSLQIWNQNGENISTLMEEQAADCEEKNLSLTFFSCSELFCNH